MAAPREPVERWQRWGPALAAVAAHVLALRNAFVLDDFTLITENPYTRTLAGLKVILGSGFFVASATPDTPADYYRPISGLVNWLSWQLVRDSSVLQHAITLGFHVVVSVLLASTLRRWHVSGAIAATAAMVFAAHPATAEIVAYVGGRQDMAGWVATLLALRALPGVARPIPLALLGVAATVVPAFCRESFLALAVVFPLAAALSGESARLDRHRLVAVAAGVSLGIGLVAAARAAAGVGWSQPIHHSPLQWLGVGVAFAGRMLSDLLLPTDLTLELTLSPPSTTLALLVVAALIAGCVLVYRVLSGPWANRRGIALTALASMATSTAIHVSVALRLGFVADRYAYPFLIAAALLGAPLAERALAALGSQLSPRLRAAGPWLPWVFTLALLPMTWARVVAYRDERTLAAMMYRDRPSDPQSIFAEASRLLDLRDYRHALPLCEAYQRHYPGSTRAARCLATCLLQTGQTALAVPHLLRAIAAAPSQADLRAALVRAELELGDVAAAQRAIDDWSAAFGESAEVEAARAALARFSRPRPGP